MRGCWLWKTLPWLAAAAAMAEDPCQAGRAALKVGDLPAAEAALERCRKAQPRVLDTYLLLCGVYQRQGNAEALEKTAVEGLKRFPDEQRFYLVAGTYAGRAKRYREAISVLEKALKRWPEEGKLRQLASSAHLGLGRQLLDGNESEQAADQLQKAAELAPDDVEVLVNLGRALHNLHRSEEALAAFARVVALNPSTPLARFHRGLTLHALGEFDAAIAELNEEIASGSEYAPAHLVRGLALMAKGEWQAAHVDLETAVRKMPEDARAQYALARCLLQMNRVGEAESGLRKAVELDPADPAPLNTLARLLMQTGRAEEAKPLAAKAAELGHRQRSAKQGEIRFDSYRSGNR